MRRAAGLGLILATAFIAAPASAQGPALLFIGIDGLRPDHVLEADRLGLRIPNLRHLVETGAHARSVIGVTPAVTYPSFTTLITGRWPAGHGIVANTTFDPLGQNQGGWYWYAEDVKTETLWDVAARAGRTVANVHWPVSVGARIRWNLAQIWRANTPDDRKLVRAVSTPGLEDTLARIVGKPYADGGGESIGEDENRGAYAVAMLTKYRPSVMTAYFTALDHTEHEYGPFTPEAFAVLERIDAVVGSLLSAAKRTYGDGVVVAVASDHGFATTTRSVNLGAALAQAGLITVEQGKVKDWRAAVWSAGGSGAIVLHDSTDATTLEAVRALLARLASDTANGIAHVAVAAELALRGAFTGAAFAVDLAPGYRLGGTMEGPLVVNGDKAGTHGYFSDRPDMRSTFLVTGPGVAAGRNLGDIDMRDIAPTLAGLVGLRLPHAEGHPLFPPP